MSETSIKIAIAVDARGFCSNMARAVIESERLRNTLAQRDADRLALQRWQTEGGR